MRTPEAMTALRRLTVVALTAVLVPAACGKSEREDGSPSAGSGGKGSSGTSGRGGAAAGRSGGTAQAGDGGTSGNTGSGGKGGSAGRGGSGGKGGSAGNGGSETSGSGGDAGAGSDDNGGMAGAGADAGESGRAGSAGTSGQAGRGTLPDGGMPGTYLTSCAVALAQQPSAGDGIYMLDPDGEGDGGPIPLYCDMVGGGWTMVLVKNSMDNGHYATFASENFNLDALTIPAENASGGTAPAIAGWLDVNEFSYTELVIAGYENGAEVYRSEPIPKSELRIPFGQDGYYLYDQVDGYYWCGGSAAFTTDGIGQVDKPSGAPDDCKGHTSLGDGWDFGTSQPNAGLTVCGGGSALMTARPGGTTTNYGNGGVAQAIWVR